MRSFKFRSYLRSASKCIEHVEENKTSKRHCSVTRCYHSFFHLVIVKTGTIKKRNFLKHFFTFDFSKS